LVVPKSQRSLDHARVKAREPVGLSKHDFGDRSRIGVVGLSVTTTMLPMAFCEQSGHLEDCGSLGTNEDGEGVPVAASPFDAPFRAAESTTHRQCSLMAVFRRWKRDPLDDLTDTVEKHCRVRALVAIDPSDDPHAHLR
jgi:hypothetical protein